MRLFPGLEPSALQTDGSPLFLTNLTERELMNIKWQKGLVYKEHRWIKMRGVFCVFFFFLKSLVNV